MKGGERGGGGRGKEGGGGKVGHIRGPFRGSVYTVCVWGLSHEEIALAQH